jgi:hypothetical protein
VTSAVVSAIAKGAHSGSGRLECHIRNPQHSDGPETNQNANRASSGGQQDKPGGGVN